jgi:hypothetical protein
MLDSEMHNQENCIAACLEAIRACHTCAAEDIRLGTSLCALICLDCADICLATMNSMARRSSHHGDFAAVCAHICHACEAACEPHAELFAHCAACQLACQKCAAECIKHAKERHI